MQTYDLKASEIERLKRYHLGVVRALDLLSAEVLKPKHKGNGKKRGSICRAIGKLLIRPHGCTAKEICKLTGWPSVHVVTQAKLAGLVKFRKIKKPGKLTRYYANAPR